ncbi:MAG: hypothetical protein ACLP0B_10605 [Steroidobacteraceae bacterium]
MCTNAQCHRIPNFMEKARRANVFNMFVGLENINADTLIAMKKRQNKISEYRALFLACKQARILTMAGYILGFPNDTPESIIHDIEIIKRELPIDLLEFFFLTPLPGSEDHQKLAAQGAWMDPDLNKYDLSHTVARHSTMSQAEWEAVFRKAWATYYTPEHIVTVMRRGEAFGLPFNRTLEGLVYFHHFTTREHVHPLEGGFIRMKWRTDRRTELARENPLTFYPRVVAEAVGNFIALWRFYTKFRAIGKAIEADLNRFAYTDRALTPVTESDDETLELLTHNATARAAVERHRFVQRLTASSER